MPNGTAHNCANCCNFVAKGSKRFGRPKSSAPSFVSGGKCKLRLEKIDSARWMTCANFNDPDAQIKGGISLIEFDKSGEHGAYKLVGVDVRKVGSGKVDKVKRVKGMG